MELARLRAELATTIIDRGMREVQVVRDCYALDRAGSGFAKFVQSKLGMNDS